MRCCFAALGLPLDLEIGKRSSTSTTSLDSLSFVGLQGYVFYGCISTRCLYLVDRSWYIVVPIVGKFLFSMLRTLQTRHSSSPPPPPPPPRGRREHSRETLDQLPLPPLPSAAAGVGCRAKLVGRRRRRILPA